jgi:peptidoglycan/xylan/chitin deacetylase (PgdA/CDA1 family)
MLRDNAILTTSWDDGHPSDFRVADLLAKYGLRGTFYVPRTAETATMSPAHVRDLSDNFEIGGHTVNHVVLTEATDDRAGREIAESKPWLEDITGRPCPMFCPPKGKYYHRHLGMIRAAGFSGVRTVELLSLDFPRPTDGLMLMPTTVQAHPHGVGAYARNLVRRAAVRNLWLAMLHGRTTDWLTLTRRLLTRAIRRGGVFHLWGHSWELDASDQWGRLEDAFRLMSEFALHAAARTNGEVLGWVEGAERERPTDLRIGEPRSLRSFDPSYKAATGGPTR